MALCHIISSFSESVLTQVNILLLGEESMLVPARSLTTSEQIVDETHFQLLTMNQQDSCHVQGPLSPAYQTTVHNYFYLRDKCIFTHSPHNNWYLTIRPIAPKGYGSIAHEAKPNGLLTHDPWGWRVQLFWYHPTSRTEKAIIKLANASWRKIYLGKKTKEKPANFATRWWLLIVA